MEDFDIINLTYANSVLIIIKTCESPFQYINEIEKKLEVCSYEGNVIIDQLLHSGNNEERFIGCYVANNKFVSTSFTFLKIKKGDPIRRFISEYLREDTEYLDYNGMTDTQRKLIKSGCVV